VNNLKVERHENMFTKLIIPMFEDIFSFITIQNCDSKGRTLDADLKVKLERYLIQMKKAKEGKHFTTNDSVSFAVPFFSCTSSYKYLNVIIFFVKLKLHFLL